MDKHIRQVALANERLYTTQARLGIALLGDESTQKQRNKARDEAALAAQAVHETISAFEEAYGLNQEKRERLQTLLQEGLETENPLQLHEVLHKIATELGIQPFAMNGTAK